MAVAAATSSRRVRAFKRWMRSHGFQLSDSLAILDCPAAGLSVRALRHVGQGDVVATIPKRACLTLKTTAARDLVSSAAVGGYLGLSVAIMYERSLGDASTWAPYLRLLPYAECLPLVWNPLEVDTLLRGTELHKTVKEDMALIYEDWEECILPLLDLEPFRLDPRFFGVQDYFAAKTLIASRSFEIDDYHGFGMVPFADIFNHKTAAEDVHFTAVSPHSDSENENETKSNGESDLINTDDDGSDDMNLDIAVSEEKLLNDSDVEDHSVSEDDSATTLEIIMIKDVKAGNEVYNTYGLLGNAALLHRYGFTEPGNPFDIVNIDMELVLQWSASLFTNRYCRTRVSLWRRLGYSGCVSQNSEYFEISFDGEPQTELLFLLHIMFLQEDTYCKLDFCVSTSGSLEELKGDLCMFSKMTSEMLMNKKVCGAVMSLADMREGLYGSNSIEDDGMELQQCCPVKNRKKYHSLMLRISERTILKKLRLYVAPGIRSTNAKRSSGRKNLKGT